MLSLNTDFSWSSSAWPHLHWLQPDHFDPDPSPWADVLVWTWICLAAVDLPRDLDSGLPPWACPVLRAWDCGTLALVHPRRPSSTGLMSRSPCCPLLLHDTGERKICGAGGIWFYVECVCVVTERNCKCIMGTALRHCHCWKKQRKTKKKQLTL